MSDPKCATIITVGAPKSEKQNVTKTVRLNINLDESNESKYPELNFKELVIAEVKKKKVVENGKSTGLNPYSDNDDDVERVAKKFEQKYGGKSTYGKKSKQDDFADIGAGYDENDSFIDNDDCYDEVFPPECETYLGGFYINSGLLEFKNVESRREVPLSDAELAHRKNKRRLSSSISSEQESSESSSGSDPDAGGKAQNGGERDTAHRKKKKKNADKKNPSKVRRTDSSAATSGKQTSDDNNPEGSLESDSRTSQSSSLASKRAASDVAATSDSSRDVEIVLPPAAAAVLEELECLPRGVDAASAQAQDNCLIRLESALSGAEPLTVRAGWGRAARALRTNRHKAMQRATHAHQTQHTQQTQQPQQVQRVISPIQARPAIPPAAVKRTHQDTEDLDNLTEEQREALIVDTLKKLKSLIDERTPGMMANYNAECERVQEERKKLQIACSVTGDPPPEKRLPKRRFPWCGRARALLAKLRRIGGPHAVALLSARALPLFPAGFVRMPTLLRQADLNKEMKPSEVKRSRLNSTSLPAPMPTHTALSAHPVQSATPQITEQIQFPSSLTVTTTLAKQDKNEVNDKETKYRNSAFGTIINSFSLSKDLVVEKEKEIDKREDVYIPPNNIGSITITPVSHPHHSTEKKSPSDKKEGLIRVKSPAALNEMAMQKKDKLIDSTHHKKDKDKHKNIEKVRDAIKEKRVNSPLHIDTNMQPAKRDPTPSPKSKDEITQRQIESMRVAENNIPRPALVPVHHSPTFAKPDKRPPEVKKKRDIVIVSDVDPLSDIQQEPLAIDDSSSDVEVVEDSKSVKCSDVPLRDSESARDGCDRLMDTEENKLDEAMKEDFNSLMKNLRVLETSQDPKLNSFGGVLANNAKRDKSSSQSAFSSRSIFDEPRADNKFTERTSLNNTDGCSVANGWHHSDRTN